MVRRSLRVSKQPRTRKSAERRSSPRLLVVGNWKMELLTAEAEDLAKELAALVRRDKLDLVLCPSFPALPGVAEVLRRSRIMLGAQDLFWADRGAFTGEVAARDLYSLGCRHVIIGHSERRREVHETDEMINRKVLAALSHGLSPIVCLGESREQRQANLQHHVVNEQLHAALRNVPPPRHGMKVIVAYEPIWAIGTGTAAQPEDAHDIAAAIHQTLVDVYGERVANAATSILYGGSVSAENVAAFVDRDRIQGVLVGGASLSATSFSTLIKKLSST